MDNKAEAERFVGIDVTKDSVEAHVRPDQLAFGCGTRPADLAGLVTRLKPLNPVLVVMEATGGFESLVAAALIEAGLPVAVVNPRQTRKFAGAVGRLAKTDTIDAAIIAHFGEAVRPRVAPPPDAETVRLSALLARRTRLIGHRTAEQQRLDRALDADTRWSCQTILRGLKAEIALIERLIDKHVNASPAFLAKQDLLKTIPGIGDVVARTFLAELPEPGTPDRHQIAALAAISETDMMLLGIRDHGPGRGVDPRTTRGRAALYSLAFMPRRGRLSRHSGL